jgi:hypothetical protein
MSSNKQIKYNLSNIPGFMDFMKNGVIPIEYQKYYSSHNYYTISDDKYLIIRYNKEILSSDIINTYGLLRSVIAIKKKINIEEVARKINFSEEEEEEEEKEESSDLSEASKLSEAKTLRFSEEEEEEEKKRRGSENLRFSEEERRGSKRLKVVCYSPPKSLSCENFMIKYPIKTKHIIAEEFIEGTMINVFYDLSIHRWQIATRNTVGADVSFYTSSNMTFNDMFMDACLNNQFNIEMLNPNYCYSFVLQHSANRIVVPIKHSQLYLVGVYEINQDENNIEVIEQNLSDVKTDVFLNMTKIRFPERYEFSTYSELIEKFASTNTPYEIMGIIIKNMETGERTKIRNPIYEEVKQLRGNQPKLQYQYLCLRHSGKLPLFLKYYPETKQEMSKFRDQVHMFTESLHKNYISCYVKKEKSLQEYSNQYRTHMFKLHEHFINNLRPKKLYISNTEVIKYVNNLHPSLLMYSLNFNMRKRLVDNIQNQI